jgi:methylmalonyl-CoA mutase N-terminal domain/subunit
MYIKPIYTSEDWTANKEEISGEFPFKRGHLATMYASKHWTVR